MLLRRAVHLLVLASVLVTAEAKAARGRHEVELFLGGDLILPGPALPDPGSPNVDPLTAWRRGWLPQHAFMGAGWRWLGFWRPNTALGVVINTDTLHAQLDAWNVGLRGLSLSLYGRAEALGAGLLIDPIRDGKLQWAEAFTGSYALVGGRVTYSVLHHLHVEAELNGRAWLFTPFVATAPTFRFPSPFVVAEPRARIKWLGSRVDRQRLGLRQGIDVLVEAGVDARALSGPFGGKRGGPPDPRNNLAPGALPRRIFARGFAGMNLLRVVWLQASGEAGYGQDEDDITRARIGGLNPYVVTMPGAAWGEFWSERFAAAHLEAGITATPLLYVGMSGHVAAVNDPRRVGDVDAYGLLRGLAAEARLGLWGYGVIHLRAGGNLDVIRPGGRGGFSAAAVLHVWWPR